MRLSVITFIGAFFLLGCTREEAKESPNQLQQSNKVEESKESGESTDTSIADESRNDLKRAYHITFDREQSFGTTDRVIVGEIASFAVGNRNRVFIADMKQTNVHMFDSNGSYITSLGRQGKGPAEFTAITPNTVIKIHSNKLIALDYVDGSTFFPTRAQIFSLNNLSFYKTIKLIAVNREDYSEHLDGYYPSQIFPRNDGKFLVSYRRTPNDYQDSTSYIRYFVQDSTGRIIRGPILEQKDRTNLVYLVEKVRVPHLAINSFPFYSKSLFVMSSDNNLYAAQTGDFQIDVYNSNGQHIRQFSHPFKSKAFDKEALIDRYKRTDYKSALGDGVAVKMIEEAENLPETWPILESMLFDDQDRLWVSTIVENNEIYQWWLLKKNGDIITKFNWPRDKPIKEVKNGYMYTLETEQKTGLQEVICYRIEMDNTD